MDCRGKNVLVVGMARSGMGAVRLLLEHGAHVIANDSKTREQLGDAVFSLDDRDIEWRLGLPAGECLDNVELVVISPGIPDTAPFVKKAAEMGIPVIGELELAYRFAEGMLIAVTGTNGKTTTVSLLGEIFKDAGKTVHVAGNIGTPYSEAAVVSKKSDVTICEVSSFQLETADRFRPHIAVFTNLTEDHLDRHGSMEVYGALKARIFRNQTSDDWAVLNADDREIKKLYKGFRGKVLRFSARREVNEGAFVKDGAVYFRMGGEARKICETADIRIKGEHNLENALAAVCAAGAAGVPAPVIRHGLRVFSCAEHRIEFVAAKRGTDYYDDSKGTNVDATIRALRAMDKPTAVILGGVDKHCPFEPLAAEMKNDPLIRFAVLIGEAAPRIGKALEDAGFTDVQNASSMRDAVQKAAAAAQAGWNVLLSPACSSFDMFSDYEERGRVFKSVVREMTDCPREAPSASEESSDG